MCWWVRSGPGSRRSRGARWRTGRGCSWTSMRDGGLFGADPRPAAGVMAWYLERRQRCREGLWETALGILRTGTDVYLESGLLTRRQESTRPPACGCASLSLEEDAGVVDERLQEGIETSGGRRRRPRGRWRRGGPRRGRGGRRVRPGPQCREPRPRRPRLGQRSRREGPGARPGWRPARRGPTPARLRAAQPRPKGV